MITTNLRAFWNEPRPAQPPVWVWRDGALVGTVAFGTVVEVLLRENRSWLPAAVIVSVVIGLTLLWRRTQPLPAVAVAFGTLIVFDLGRIVVIDTTGLFSIAAVLVLPYALLRWGPGREAVIGLGIILMWLGVTHIADPTTASEVVAGYGFFLFSAALGASMRFRATTRVREIEQAELRQRHELARDLHDTVGHHVLGIIVQAQAGQALAATQPDRVPAVLATIEDAAAKALEEMRTMVGVLRDGTEPDLAPQPDIASLEQLARTTGGPRIDVHLSGMLDDIPTALGAALYRIAQEALTNTMRHARNATGVSIEVTGDPEQVRLSVRDDGDSVSAVGHASTGFGLAGMRERAALLGGTLLAGPRPEGGWIVEATFPRRNAATGYGRSPLPDRSV